MLSRCLNLGLVAALPLLCAGLPVLRVCADPNNLPFSNHQEAGLENRLAALMARDLGAELRYTWWSERKSFIRQTLGADRCDVVMGIPAAMDAAETTRPYYRSTYVFLTRKDRKLEIASLFDPRLEKWRIGMHVVDNDYAPPAQALAQRGLRANIAGYSLFGAYGDENPPARLVDAVARGEVDVAIIWGPFAGYFAPRAAAPLEIVPVSPPMYFSVPFTYEIAMGVRKGNHELRDSLDRVLARECPAVQSLLREYGIPRVEEEGDPCASSH